MKARGFGRIFQPRYAPAGQTFKQAKAAGTLRKSAVWWVAYSRRGKEYRESSHSMSRADAVRLLNLRRGDIARGEWIAPAAERTTLSELIDMVETDRQLNARSSSDHLGAYKKRAFAFFGPDSRAADITSDRLDAYKASRRADGAANATINRELAALRRGFRLAYEAGKVRRLPRIKLLREHNVRQGFFERAEFEAVSRHLPEHLQSVAEFASLTGWRKGEILKLTWRQVDFAAGTIRLEPGTTKNSEGRVFPFSALPPLAALLNRRRERTRAVERATDQIVPWVFHRDGRPIKHFRRAWEAACIAAGFFRIDPRTKAKRATKLFHDFRRTAVRNLERAGVPRSVAMTLTGHKTENVYRRYAIVAEGDQREGVAKLAALHATSADAPPQVIPLAAQASDRRLRSKS